MKTRSLTAALALALLFVAASFAQIPPPGVVNYQGVLRDASGAPLTGTYEMIFRIFDAPTGGNEYIRDLHVVAGSGAVTVTDGLFNVEVGSGVLQDGTGSGTYTSLAPVFRSTTDFWLEVQVGAEVLSPRIHFASASTAFNAASLNGYTSSAFPLKAGAETITGDWVNTANPWADNEVADALTVSGGTISGSVLTLEQGTAPADTAEGRLQWDTDDDTLVVGTGAGTATFRSASGSDTRYLRKDTADTAAGAITFTAATTDIRGQIVDGDSTYVTVGEDCYVSGGHLGVGTAPNSARSLSTSLTVNSAAQQEGIYSSVTNTSTSTAGADLFGVRSAVDASGSGNAFSVLGVSGTATGAADSTGARVGVWGTATGGNGPHYGILGQATQSASSGTHIGVYGIASGGIQNWGFFTTGNAYVGGVLDLGSGVDDDLTASDVTDLTDGGATTLHTHAAGDAQTLDGIDSADFLRSDVWDTAYGVITFAGATTDIRGQIVDGDSSYVTVGEDCYVSGGHLGVGTPPVSSQGISSATTLASATAFDGMNLSLTNSAGGGAGVNQYGVRSTVDASGSANGMNTWGMAGTATGASNSTGMHFGLFGNANGGNGSHYGVFGQAMQASSSGTHYGLYGTASGGAVNWGLYTPNDAYVGGKLDLGSGASDDLTASDVTDLTDGGATTLHTHDITGSGDARYLRKDVADTAAGVITFTGASTDVRGQLLDGDSTYLTVNDDLYVVGDSVGIGTAPSSTYGLRVSRAFSSTIPIYGGYSAISNTGTGEVVGWDSYATASGAGSTSHAIGVRGLGQGSVGLTGSRYGVVGIAQVGDGSHYGLYGIASSTSSVGTHYGLFATASGGATNWGLYTPDDTYVGGTLTSGNIGVGTAPDVNQAGTFSITKSVNGLMAGVVGSATGTYTGGTGRATGGFFEGISSAAALSQESDGVYATATGPSGSTGSRYGVRAWAYGGNGASVGVSGSAGNSIITDTGTHYGLYGTAVGGAVNWGIYTPDNLQFGDAITDSHVFWGTLKSGSSSDAHTIIPFAGNWGYIGTASNFWYGMYARTYYGQITAIQAFDIYRDLDLLDAMEMVEHTDPKTGRTSLIFSPETLPPMIKGDPAVDGAGADQFVDLSKAVGFCFGSFRQMRAEVRTGLTGVQAQLEARTADPVTGNQSVPGNLSIQLDRDADDRARFSVFKDGGTDVAQELMRLDEEGNLHLKGALRPSALDLAEYHPVAGPASAGDVLVVDRTRPGFMRRCATAGDRAVVGIVSTEPGVVLGSGLQRVAAADPEVVEALDLARRVGDQAEEARLWAELERRFSAGHAAIALSGTVPCKVDAAYGPVEVGDLLVASPTPGHAMRSDDPSPGTVVAKALEPLSGGTGVIRVLVMLR